MSGLNVQIIVDQDDVKQLEKIPSQTERAAVRMVARLLDKIEDATLIKRYTQTANPSKPSGSTYVRTFRMQKSSEKTMVRDKLPIEGRWEAKTQYASYVIGPSAGQAAIHSGRWPVLELAVTNANVIAPQIFDEEMSRENI